MIVDALAGKRGVFEVRERVWITLGGRVVVGRALVEELRVCRACRACEARWMEELGSVGVLAPLRRKKLLFSEVSGGRLTPDRCGGGRMEVFSLLAPGREILGIPVNAGVELGGFGSRDED